MQVTTVNGVELSYLSLGTGPHAILCIPGALGTATHHYQPQLDHFGKDGSGFKIVSFNPRGYGGNSKVQRPTENPIETDAKDGYELMKVLSIREFTVLGWCDGGSAAIILASKFPEAVKKLIVFGSRSYITEEEIKVYETTRDVRNWDADSYRSKVDIYGFSFQQLWSNWLDSLIKYHTLNKGDICTKELPRVLCPTLIIHGKNNGMCPMSHAEYLRDHIPGSRLEIIKDGRHMIHFKHQYKFNKLVEEFLKAV